MLIMHYWHMTEQEALRLPVTEFSRRLKETETLIRISSPFGGGEEDKEDKKEFVPGKPIKAGPEAIAARKQWMNKQG